jgi:hypothetical protein
MNARQLALVLLRVMGLYFFIIALPRLSEAMMLCGYVMTTGAQAGDWVMVVSSLGPSVGYLLAAGLLIVMAPSIAGKMLRGTEARESDPVLPTDAGALTPVVFAAMGLWLAGTGAPFLIHNATKLVMLAAQESRGDIGMMMQEVWSLVVGGGVQVGLGLVLFVGARPIASWWRRLRTAGINKGV